MLPTGGRTGQREKRGKSWPWPEMVSGKSWWRRNLPHRGENDPALISKGCRRHENCSLAIRLSDRCAYDEEARGPAQHMEESLTIRYRKHASYCRVQAARSRDADHKARWLEFAQAWEMLADEANQGAGLRVGLSNDPGARAPDIGHP
jgi:hypothetical protein